MVETCRKGSLQYGASPRELDRGVERGSYGMRMRPEKTEVERVVIKREASRYMYNFYFTSAKL